MSLCDLVIRSARRTPQALAIKDTNGSVTYEELDALANRFAWLLADLGVRPGDRVGIWLEKSASAIAAMQGILRLHAIYVPLDPLSPAARVRTILLDCDMRVLITTRRRAEIALAQEDLQALTCFCVDATDFSPAWSDLLAYPKGPVEGPAPADDAIAYILYTSGSTGKPKGVCISNRNALAFIAWAVEALKAEPSDRLANHAPFHFDLSVLDLYVAFSVGATVFLIPDEISYMPGGMVKLMMQEQLTIWYSVPSVLILMMEQGGLLERESLPLRAVLFAGEPFPIKYLRQLYEHWPSIRFLNLYGPTETNVCTFYEVTEITPEQDRPVPIGRACSGDHVWAQKDDGTLAGPHEEGELMVAGPTVMLGYWGLPRWGERPYATGDIVRLQDDGNYYYLGRRDHLVKVRGHRVEPGDIEAALQLYPAICEAAVVVEGSGMLARLIAYLVIAGPEVPSLLRIKRHCAEHLPRYMIVDAIHILSKLPRTRNGKLDRLKLANLRLDTDTF